MKADCLYFKVVISAKNTVRFVALLRSMEDNLCFDRALQPSQGIFEIYVPKHGEKRFVQTLEVLQKIGLVTHWWQDCIENSFMHSNDRPTNAS